MFVLMGLALCAWQVLPSLCVTGVTGLMAVMQVLSAMLCDTSAHVSASAVGSVNNSAELDRQPSHAVVEVGLAERRGTSNPRSRHGHS